MTWTIDELRNILGLPADGTLGVPTLFAAPVGEIGYGLAATRLDEDLRGLVAATPDWSLMPAGPPGLELARWDLDPRVLRVEGAEVVARRGALLPDGAGWLIDGRAGPALVSLFGVDEVGAAWERALCAANDVTLYEVQRPVTPDLVAALQPDPPPPEVPSVESLFGVLSAAPWLAAAAAELERRGSTHRRLAALGTVARLWSPTDAEGRERWADEVRAGRTPLQRLRAWAQTADGAIFDHAAPGVAADVERLLDVLDALREAALEGAPNANDTRRLLHERDDLEGAAIAFRMAGRDDVEGSLRVLDGAAFRATDALAAVGPLDDRRLDAAGAAAPESWWSVFGR